MIHKLTKSEWFTTTGDLFYYINIEEEYQGEYLVFTSPYLVILDPNGFSKICTGFKVDPSDTLILRLENDIRKDFIVTNYTDIYNNIILEVQSLNPKELVTINSGDYLCLGKLIKPTK